MRDIATELASRTGFGVCSIEVVRSGGLLELVTITGAPADVSLIGSGSELAHMERAIAEGERHGLFTFIRAEAMSPDTLAGVFESPPASDSSAATDAARWRSRDMLVADVRDEAGDLRALVTLEAPLDHHRPTAQTLEQASKVAAVPLRAVLTVIEREAFAHHIWMMRATRRLMRATENHEDVTALAESAQDKFRHAFRASGFEIRLIDQSWDDLLKLQLSEAILAELREAVMRAWESQKVLIIEPSKVWNDDVLGEEFAHAMAEALEPAGHSTLVVAPVGAESEVVGAMFITRPPAGRRWTDSQIDSALDLGHDFGHSIVNARSVRRERALSTQLRDQDELRRTVLRTIAHELKSPITVIRANSELLQDMDIGEAGQARLRAIDRGVARLTDMVGDLAMLMKVTDPTRSKLRVMVRLKDILDEVVGSLVAVAETANVTLEMKRGGPISRVEGDPSELYRAITNIVDNAVKYSSPGDRVAVWVDQDDDMVVVTCKDEGLGISEEDQEPLFTPFFRSTNEEALSRPGSGLGLDIVRRIVERHGGRIHVSSTLGIGTTVRILLPAAPGSPE